MKLYKNWKLLLIFILCITTSCITKVQVTHIHAHNCGHGNVDLSEIELLQKGSDPKDSLNGNTMDALNGLPLP